MSPIACQLCGRVTKRGTTEHHLIPRSLHSNRWFKKRYSAAELRQTIDVCRDCHKAIHELVPDEKELGRNYHTLAALQAHPGIARYLQWARKQK
jgi:hypothetical protein